MTVALRIQLRESEIFILGNSQRTDSKWISGNPNTPISFCSKGHLSKLAVGPSRQLL
jgi:hypothetical protein